MHFLFPVILGLHVPFRVDPGIHHHKAKLDSPKGHFARFRGNDEKKIRLFKK